MSDLAAAANALSRDHRFMLADLTLDFGYAREALQAAGQREHRDRWRQAQKFVSAMFQGMPVNRSENRAALHTALRWPTETPPPFSADILTQVTEERERMLAFAEAIRDGAVKGSTGKPITTVVNLGVGGSDLGSRLLVDAFQEQMPRHLSIEFAATMDGIELLRILRRVDLASTLFIVASKSFRTVDTLLNAQTAVTALEHALGLDRSRLIASHMVAVSANPGAMSDWGVPAERQFRLWSWVGGRYSVWSAIGLAAAVALGRRGFEAFLAGAHQVDRHVLEAGIQRSLPGLMGWVAYYHAVLKGIRHQAILPYDTRLAALPRYITQLEMESLGKSCNITGAARPSLSGPAVTGELGTLAQHAIMQHLHQASDEWSAEFIVINEPLSVPEAHLTQALHTQWQQTRANQRSQAQLLAEGYVSSEDSDPYAAAKYCRPGKPSLTVELNTLGPAQLGQLLALYEHKTTTFAALAGLNPFDQWAAEAGKQQTKARLNNP